MSQSEILGRTFKFPFTLSGRSDIEVTSGNKVIEESLLSLIRTASANDNSRIGGDRIFNRNVGLNLNKWLFISDNVAAREGMKDELKKLELLEPRVRILTRDVVKSPLQPNQWDILLTYQIKATQEIKNLVTPILDKSRNNVINEGEGVQT